LITYLPCFVLHIDRDLIEEITCNTLDDLKEFNCKLGQCEKFDDIQVECTSGICKNISQAYKCEFQVKHLNIIKMHTVQLHHWLPSLVSIQCQFI
jgi:hypothetical protein